MEPYEACDEIIALVFGRGCDPAQLCDRPGAPPGSGVTLAALRADLGVRLGGRALREALAIVDASEATDAAWRAREAIRGMR